MTPRYQITFNGEIYNYLELKTAIDRPVSFRTQGDTEVLLAAFARWGTACLDRLIGMFAFAIWDEWDQTLFAARDRFGVKPLYYYEPPGGGLWLASEIKSVTRRRRSQGTGRGHVGDLPGVGSVRPRRLDVLERGPAITSGGLPVVDSERWPDGQNLVRPRRRRAQPEGEPLCESEAGEALLALLEESVRLRFPLRRAGRHLSVGRSGFVAPRSAWCAGCWARVRGSRRLRSSAVTQPTMRPLGADHAERVPASRPLLQARRQRRPSVGATDAGVSGRTLRGIANPRNGPGPRVRTASKGSWFCWTAMGWMRPGQATTTIDGPHKSTPRSALCKARSRRRPVAIACGPSSRHGRGGAFFFFNAERPLQDPLRDLQYRRDVRYAKIPRAMRFADRCSMMYGRELREPFLDHRIVELGASAQPAAQRSGTGKANGSPAKSRSTSYRTGCARPPASGPDALARMAAGGHSSTGRTNASKQGWLAGVRNGSTRSPPETPGGTFVRASRITASRFGSGSPWG